MSRSLATFAVISSFAVTALAGQRAATPPRPSQLQVVAVVGCVAAEGDSWILTHATGPLVVPTSDGRGQSGSGVTAQRAKAEPLGKERYRLMNVLEELGVARHKDQKALVKGLLLGDAKDRRINLVAFEVVDPTCSDPSRQ